MDADLSFYEVSVNIFVILWVVIVLEVRLSGPRVWPLGWIVLMFLFTLTTALGIIASLGVLESGVAASWREEHLVELMLIGAFMCVGAVPALALIEDLINRAVEEETAPNRALVWLGAIWGGLVFVAAMAGIVLVFLN